MRNKRILLLLFIIALGIFFRLYNVTNTPQVNRDELSIGYNAYSILKTLKDEHGQKLPINFQAFGEYKLPGLIYLTTIPIYFFGLNIFSIRLINIIFGVLLIPITYLVSKNLKLSKTTQIISTVLISSSFWHIHASRSSYEPTIALTMSALALLFLIKSWKDVRWYIPFSLLFLVNIFIYNSPLVLLPMLFALSVLIQKKQNFKKNITPILITLFSIIAIIFSFSKITAGVNQSRWDTTVFHNKVNQINIDRNLHKLNMSGTPLKTARIIQNKPVLVVISLFKNYISAFDPNYLFFIGDHNPWHSLLFINLGNINPLLLPFIYFGIFHTIVNWKNHNKERRFLLMALFISAIPNGITIDSPITNRLLFFHWILLFFASFGFMDIYKKIKSFKILKKAYFPTAALLLLLSFTYYWISYQTLLPLDNNQLWIPEARELIDNINQKEMDFDRVIIPVKSDLSMSYIYLLFFNKYDPTDFQSTSKRSWNGFYFPDSFGKYEYITVNPVSNIDIQQIHHLFSGRENDRLLVIREANQDTPLQGHQFILTDYWDQPTWIADELSIPIIIRSLENSQIKQIEKIDYLKTCQISGCKNPN